MEAADPDELVRRQAGAADQRAVDVGLRHDPGDVAGLDRAAVQDADRVGQLRRRSSSASRARIARADLLGVSGVATSPVPMAQTGS